MESLFSPYQISGYDTAPMIKNKQRLIVNSMAMIMFLVAYGNTESRVSGIIDVTTRWTPEDGPYIVNGDIMVAKKAKLVIAPGTKILISQPLYYDSAIQQIDHLDSQTVSIKIKGMLTCAGRKNKRIKISPIYKDDKKCSWYGIVFDNSYNELTEIAYADIAGAFHGVVAINSSPLLRNSVMEYNNVGISCREKGNMRVYNCIVASNFASGIRVGAANPEVYNTIVAFNRNYGVWGDNASAITFEYNCAFGNPDGNFLDCNPRLGIVDGVNKNKDSVDFAHNLVMDPIFAGSASDSAAVEKDIAVPTDKSKLVDTTLAKAVGDTLVDSLAAGRRTGVYARYSLSSYSPCIDAGKPGKAWKDDDGSRNDMGIYGGREFFDPR
ncbi:MAG: hypothetical protein GF401_11135 [Chitinivibrionales bacterium]|nr:hypothetical protein [Chitinivibrionales bacterium]